MYNLYLESKMGYTLRGRKNVKVEEFSVHYSEGNCYQVRVDSGFVAPKILKMWGGDGVI